MKKIIKTIGVTLSMIVILNGGSRIINIRPTENQNKDLSIIRTINSCIDPEPTGK